MPSFNFTELHVAPSRRCNVQLYHLKVQRVMQQVLQHRSLKPLSIRLLRATGNATLMQRAQK